ncbi:MAG: hypothetical protein KC646_14520 [Candidatus Cloacimonetes bacterium]|nr:hypothetical protein [Candidatus Cloacimonadota bacterium]
MKTDNYTAYLYFRFLPNDRVIGGLLLLNEQNYPKDFRYCTSDDINPVQKALYGDKLSSYLIQSSCNSLLDKLEFEPNYVITNNFLSNEVLDATYPFFHASFSNGESQLRALNTDEKEIPPSINDSSIITESFKRIENALKILIPK